MPSLYLFMIGSYWIFLSGTIYLAGAFTARHFITGPSGAAMCLNPEKNMAYGTSAVPVILIVAICTLIANILHMIMHCSVMTETPLTEVWGVLPLFLLKTKYGMFSLMRTILLILSSAAIYCLIKWPGKWLRGICYSLVIVLLITLSMSGHQGTRGYASIPFFIDMLHILAISLWIGGIFFLYSNYACLCTRSDKEHWQTFMDMINRFSFMATLCVGVVVVSGLVLFFYEIKDPSEVFEMRYGSVLVIKTGLAVILMIVGGANKFFFIPGLMKTGQSDWKHICSLRNRLFKAMTLEVYLGLAILLTTSYLTHLSPDQ